MRTSQFTMDFMAQEFFSSRLKYDQNFLYATSILLQLLLKKPQCSSTILLISSCCLSIAIRRSGLDFLKNLEIISTRAVGCDFFQFFVFFLNWSFVEDATDSFVESKDWQTEKSSVSHGRSREFIELDCTLVRLSQGSATNNLHQARTLAFCHPHQLVPSIHYWQNQQPALCHSQPRLSSLVQ